MDVLRQLAVEKGTRERKGDVATKGSRNRPGPIFVFLLAP